MITVKTISLNKTETIYSRIFYEQGYYKVRHQTINILVLQKLSALADRDMR